MVHVPMIYAWCVCARVFVCIYMQQPLDLILCAFVHFPGIVIFIRKKIYYYFFLSYDKESTHIVHKFLTTLGDFY